MLPSSTLAHRFRRTLLAGAVLAWVAALAFVLLAAARDWHMPFAPMPFFLVELFSGLEDLLGSKHAWLWPAFGLAQLGVVLWMQWLFLRPRKGLAPRLAREGRPLRGAVVAAAFVVTLVSAGFVFTLLQLLGSLKGFESLWIVELAMLALWGFWTWLFWVHWRGGTRYEQLRRMTRRLFAGSVLELLVAIPADVWAAKREDCYCARGSYWGVCLGGAALLWAFGPGVVLLLVREKVERERRAGAA
jgi:hypothetical protein